VIVLFAEGVRRFLFYYSVAATEIRVTAIIPASMRRA
jgi:hypothetical protein